MLIGLHWVLLPICVLCCVMEGKALRRGELAAAYHDDKGKLMPIRYARFSPQSHDHSPWPLKSRHYYVLTIGWASRNNQERYFEPEGYAKKYERERGGSEERKILATRRFSLTYVTFNGKAQ